MNIYETHLNDTLIETLISMSADWETEDSTYGYRKNDRSDIEAIGFFSRNKTASSLVTCLDRRQSQSERLPLWWMARLISRLKNSM